MTTLNITAQLVEKIQTGLTANYVPYWTVVQGLKEAMQNIAYGAIKSGKPAKLYYDSKEEMWSIKDKYTGFEKRHLYIGESDQRDDEQGLGTFGEGWKIFLLVMARNGIKHHVSTVGFTFWGDMEPTPHGTEVLVIKIKENDQQSGTKVYADVEEEQWKQATQSFAVLQGIDPKLTMENRIFESRLGELWIQGVRIEQGEDTNPLKLYYSYNLKQRTLINRDRSHVNTELAYDEIKRIVFELPEIELREYISMALDGKQQEDILRGPWVPAGAHGHKEVWLEILAELHATTPDKLLIPSYNHVVNSEAKKKGYVTLDTPRKWDFELTYLGIKKADDVIHDRYDIVEEGYSGGRSREEKSAFAKAKAKFKRVFKLGSVNELPQFQYVEEIRNPLNDIKKLAHFDKSINVIYVDTSIMGEEKNLFDEILPELIEWKFGKKDIYDMERIYKQLISNLLF